jgi:uncharacterized protein (DUF488 family)
MPKFLSLLTMHGIEVVADVRSQPYSRFHGHFNRESLVESLRQTGIQYVFLGRELGARRAERESYRDNQARYDLICRLPAFNEGLVRIRRGLIAHRIALLCAEKDPIVCHRTILVCRRLRSDPIEIRHILEDGAIETNEQAESRLLEAVGVPTSDFFLNHSDLVEQAYDLQSERIAYIEAETPSVASGGTA